MKYLAFDIEAANGYMPSSICSFGYVIADESFAVIERRNIWINPKTKYNLNGTRDNVGIDLHLDKALLDASPDFSEVYPEIKSLLTAADTLVLGHAVDADVRMLNAACERYKLAGIDFRFICSQLLFKMYRGDKEVRGLAKIAAEIGVEFCQHNSEEDAYASMMTLKYLVADSGLTVEQLLEKYRIRYGTNVKMQLFRPVSLLGQVSKKQVTQVALARIKDYCQTVPVVDRKLSGKVFALARSTELSDSDELWAMVNAIVSHGGKYTSKLAKCNLYVLPVTPTPTDKGRQVQVDRLAAEGKLRVITPSDVLDNRL